MTLEQIRLINDFTEYEILRGYKSFKKIKYFLKIYFKYLDQTGLEITRIKHKDAQNFQGWLSTLTNDKGNVHYAVKTVLDIVNVVMNFYNYLKVIHLVYANPFRGIKLLKLEKTLPKNLPDEKQMNKYLKKFKHFWEQKDTRNARFTYKTHVIAELMYSSGLRIDEVAKLKVEDIDFDRGIIVLKEGKGGKERNVYLGEYALKVLQVYIREMRDVVNMTVFSSNLFGVKDGRNLEYSLNKRLNDTAKETGLHKFTSHYFRHCIGYHLLRRGCDIRYIQLILGHEDLKSTMIYTKVDKKDLKNELDKYHPRQLNGGRS
ncbi:MAG: tyrosine-type recombinase/integrase [Actinomycetia bacterium]|nr:tyrosine-type recombinase/integrase [Actinomycetes bacterium]